MRLSNLNNGEVSKQQYKTCALSSAAFHGPKLHEIQRLLALDLEKHGVPKLLFFSNTDMPRKIL